MNPARARRLRDRPTPDLIVMFLVAIIAFVIVVSTVGGVWLRIVDSSFELDKWAIRLSGIVNTLVGAVVGYLAGRGVDYSHPHPMDRDG